MGEFGDRGGEPESGDEGVQYGGVANLIMRRVWSWLLGILVATPIVFLIALFALVTLGAGYFILWILYQ